MSDIASQPAGTAFSPLHPHSRSLGWQAAGVLAGTLVLALSSYIEVPMVPVPMTMQTFAVALVGALYGWRLGAITILAWLGEAMIGLPVLAGGAGGIQHFAGPTAGYLFAFPVAGALAGWLAERGWNGNRPMLAFAAMLLANATCLVLGGLWLASMIGADKALALGVVPFLPGACVKALLGAATLAVMTRAAARLSRK